MGITYRKEYGNNVVVGLNTIKGIEKLMEKTCKTDCFIDFRVKINNNKN